VRRIVPGRGKASGASQGAMIARRPTARSGPWSAGRLSRKPFNRAVQAKRQPGSSFKPFVYAAALEKGVLPTDIRVDEPVKIGNWNPRTTAAAIAVR
jgi:penicillin-binding protein 1A